MAPYNKVLSGNSGRWPPHPRAREAGDSGFEFFLSSKRGKLAVFILGVDRAGVCVCVLNRARSRMFEEDRNDAFGSSAAAQHAAAVVNGDEGAVRVAAELPDDDDDFDMFGDDDLPGGGAKRSSGA